MSVLRFGRGCWYLLHNGLWSETTTTRNAAAAFDVLTAPTMQQLHIDESYNTIMGCGFPLAAELTDCACIVQYMTLLGDTQTQLCCVVIIIVTEQGAPNNI